MAFLVQEPVLLTMRLLRKGWEDRTCFLNAVSVRRKPMGLLVDGVWHDQWYDTSKTGGRFERSKSQFRDWVTRDGKPAEGRERAFKAEPGRYHLYVSYACPWAHRTLIFRK